MRSIFHPSRTHRIPFGAERFLAIFEGIEGGFAIGAGVICGMSFVSLDRNVLLATAFISVIVNGYNSASVKYSSEHYLDELDGHETPHPFRRYLVPALWQFVSYMIISVVSLIPLFVMGNIPNAVLYSCVITIFILLIAGYYRAYLLNMPRWRDALEIAILGLGIILIGFTSGWIIHVLLGA